MEKLLSQEEIDALLQGIEDGKVDTSAEQAAPADIVPFDFSNQDRIIRGRMPTLDVLNDLLARSLRNSFSLALRKVVDVGPRGVQMMKFGEFTRTLTVPSSLHVFKMDPLRGHAILCLDPKLVFTLVDIFFGGTGKTSFRIEGRDFTAIETKLILKVVNLILADLEKTWKVVHPLNFQYVRSEINPQFMSIVSPSDIVVIISLALELDEFTGMIFLCIPYAILEPIKGKLYSGYQTDELEMDHTWVERFIEHIRHAEVEVVVDLGKCQITVQDLLQLKVGEVLQLNKGVGDLLTGRVEGIPKILGKAGSYGRKKAFQVEEKIRPVLRRGREERTWERKALR